MWLHGRTALKEMLSCMPMTANAEGKNPVSTGSVLLKIFYPVAQIEGRGTCG
jgi:Domain of unknown function (DUF1966)